MHTIHGRRTCIAYTRTQIDADAVSRPEGTRTGSAAGSTGDICTSSSVAVESALWNAVTAGVLTGQR